MELLKNILMEMRSVPNIDSSTNCQSQRGADVQAESMDMKKASRKFVVC